MISILIVATLIPPFLSGNCDKINCRYLQSSADFLYDNEKNAFLPHQHKMRFSQPKQMCVNFLSSNDINRSDFDKMHDCSSINLKGNQIENLERNFFENLCNLESLNFDDNRLKLLPKNVFDELTGLKKLSARNNLLETLDDGLFEFNLKLESVDFSHNKLSIISPQILNNAKFLKFASFNGNFCIDLTFPDVELEDLKSRIVAMCGQRNIMTLIVSLMKLSVQIKNTKLNQEHGKLIETSTEATKDRLQTRIASNVTAMKSKVKENPKDLDVLIVSLFWLIVPIISILFVILAIISFAVYNKYFKYSLHFPRRF